MKQFEYIIVSLIINQERKRERKKDTIPAK